MTDATAVLVAAADAVVVFLWKRPAMISRRPFLVVVVGTAVPVAVVAVVVPVAGDPADVL